MERQSDIREGLVRHALLNVLSWLSGPARSLAKRRLRPPPALGGRFAYEIEKLVVVKLF